MEVKTLYSYDEDGYFDHQMLFQIKEGVYPPARTTDVAPEGIDTDTFFAKWTGEAWEAVAKPSSPADFLGLQISHKSQTPHNQEMRWLVQSICQGADGYRIKRGDALEWIVEKISDEEIAAQAIDAELADFDAALAELKDRLATASLAGDEDAVATIKAEYQQLMSTEDEEE